MQKHTSCQMKFSLMVTGLIGSDRVRNAVIWNDLEVSHWSLALRGAPWQTQFTYSIHSLSVIEQKETKRQTNWGRTISLIGRWMENRGTKPLFCLKKCCASLPNWILKLFNLRALKALFAITTVTTLKYSIKQKQQAGAKWYLGFSNTKESSETYCV